MVVKSKFRTSLKEWSTSVKGVRLWNNLEVKVRNARSICILKKMMVNLLQKNVTI